MNVLLRSGERYKALVEVNQAAISQLTPEDVFLKMCHTLRRMISYDRAALALYAPEHDALKIVARHGTFNDSFFRVGAMLGRQDSHQGWVFEHQRTILRRDVQAEREFRIEEHTIKEGLRSYCAVPMIVRGDSIGVLTILSGQKTQYGDRHADFLQEISNQMALSVNSFAPFCLKHRYTKLVCPRCIGAGGGRTTTAKYREQLSIWGKKGGRGQKRPAGGSTNATLE